jgi:hypothetical protein
VSFRKLQHEAKETAEDFIARRATLAVIEAALKAAEADQPLNSKAAA